MKLKHASALACGIIAMTTTAFAADLIVSTNDAKYQRVAGTDTFPEGAGPDSLNVIDATSFPPRIVATVEVAAAIAGPPQAVAITPDGKLAIVSAPNRYDRAAQKNVLENYLQLVDLEAKPPRVIDKVTLAHHPQGLAVNRAGTVLLAATVGGTVASFEIKGKTLVPTGELALSKVRLAGVTFTPDGQSALVALRDEQGVMVLDVASGGVTTRRERVSTGIAPYAIDVSGDGRWAVVGNVGLAGLPGDVGVMSGDADTLTLVDISKRPFRAVQHLTVPSLPEGVAISPDGRWIAAQSMDGSNLKPGNPARRERGRLVLFEIREGQAHRVGDLPAGEGGQGVVFTADSKYILVQFNVEKQIAVYAVDAGKLRDTGERLAVPGGPSSIRSMPR
ncbi:YncE family protein [Variovorax sp. J22R133]|uniref:YncE family protein n=1 Tax=Variovorax brevis TaxID=3053503 RepID=UPI00257905BF|nr:YncE family protein [Variovorax sp. J22R133]MDM0111364.1 YncE family protein [Variovorax sp. J22R133]